MSNSDWRPSPPVEGPARANILFWSLLAIGLLALLGAGYIYLGGLGDRPPGVPAVINVPGAPHPTDIPAAPLASNEVNILLLGIDQRPGQSLVARSDTMLLISINQDSGQIGMISIPRDLYVPIPGIRTDKINTAHFYGENARPGGGPTLAKEVVQNYLGVPVQYYGRFNFQAFRTIVDAIGGIDVDVPKAIDDLNYPDDNCPDPDHCGYAPFHIAAGYQHMDGTVALKYARTRYTDSDFYRARRQQQVILAIRNKVVQANMIPVLLVKAPSLLQQLSGSLSTDLTLPQMAGLAQMALTGKLDTDHIHQLVIDETMVRDATTPDGEEVLMPNTVVIQSALSTYFSQLAVSPTPVPPTPSANLRQILNGEQARIEVLNGTNRVGLARTTADWLDKAGFIVVNVGDAGRTDYTTSQIIDEGNKPKTSDALRSVLKLPPPSVSSVTKSRANGAPDITLILGRDFKLPNP